MELEELQERYSDLEKKYDSLYRENILLRDKIKQTAISKFKKVQGNPIHHEVWVG